MDCERGIADLLGLLACHLRSQLGIVGHLHPDRRGDFGDQIAGLLLFAPRNG